MQHDGAGGSAGGGLFRAEVLEAQRRRLWGDLLLTQPPGTGAALALVLALVLAAAVLLVRGEFTRTERVTGYLVPDGGVLGIRAPQPGIVAEVRVREGDHVAAGERLVRVSDPRTLGGRDGDGRGDGRGDGAGDGAADGGSAGAAAIAAIDAQIERLVALKETERARLLRERELDAAAVERLLARRRGLEAQQAALDAQMVLAVRMAERMTALSAAGHVPRQRMEAAERERLQLAREQAELDDLLIRLEDDLARTRARLVDWRDRMRGRLAELDDRVDGLRRERIDVGGRADFWLRAPRAGRIASLGVVEGEAARPGRDLMTLLAPDARMHAVLLVPSRAIGFVHPGQSVRLLYDAFPFTRFGVHAGEVVSVGRSVLAPTELDTPARAVEPVYKVRVRPETDTVRAYGRAVPLQAGMALEADLALERRRLWRWLAEPILAMRGRL